ncbi:MAG: glycoside hydrolase family 9 protein [Bacteroidota bacterium]|nr:glycoside hydrolase family 9 protein [Bacteroidota bacterium]
MFSLLALSVLGEAQTDGTSWIRINQFGYTPAGIKVAVWGSRGKENIIHFTLVDAKSSKVVFEGQAGKDFGAYGPFSNTCRLNFSSFRREGSYYLRCGEAVSPVFRIAGDIYADAPDFILRYLRQQRSGFNPFLKDSCHTHDGYTMYGPMPDTTRIDVWGGWHDATDYLQYVATSGNATYHLLEAYRDFPEVFSDEYAANGLAGSNGVPDVLDEARWGLSWLLKMHPRKDWMFNQLADDRDHQGFRLPDRDSVDYGLGKGLGRPVYFASGKPQGLGQYKNHSTGVASTAGKFASAFALGSFLYRKNDPEWSKLLEEKSISAYQLGLDKPGVSQTAPNREPYYYEEDNWVDDMELASASLFRLTGNRSYYDQSLKYGAAEKVTPWMGKDTAKHYQWYPFHNFGHFELAEESGVQNKAVLTDYYRQGIEKVWQKGKGNAFYRGVPFIWCSNNLTVSFAIQCYLYRKLSGDDQYAELEQACFDWLFGCNPWGKSMVYGLPETGDTPLHPHSSLSYLYHYPLDGGMVDGPVYGSIYKNLRGLKLFEPDKYAAFQSDKVVYHDDAGDYSTNEPTTDGSASLVYLLAEKQHEAEKDASGKMLLKSHGAIIRGDVEKKQIALVFTGDEFGDGGAFIAAALRKENIHASFFLTGNFCRNRNFQSFIKTLQQDGNYLGTHSDKHPLYCDWVKRDSLLISHRQFNEDLQHAYGELNKWHISRKQAPYFLPPYEWYNDSIAVWTKEAGLQLVCFTPGTRSNADYTYPEMDDHYLGSDSIMQSVLHYEKISPAGLNGFILLVHIGTDPRRTDKFYLHLPELIRELKTRAYQFVTISALLN